MSIGIPWTTAVKQLYIKNLSRVNVVGVGDYAKGWTVRGSNCDRGKIFVSSTEVQTGSGSCLLFYLMVPAFFLGGEADGA